MAKVKEDNFPSIRVSPKLRTETEQSADKAGENLSEYIRKAVEYRNNKVKEGK